ncbi:MAG: universal stress protein, partial [Anaerolineae bacterium]|nr:universal stress protein [Anaerolineae bacterium]
MDAAISELTNKIYSQRNLSARIQKQFSIPCISFIPPLSRTGQWRKEHKFRPGQMFTEILVPLTGENPPWPALSWAIEIAQHEHAQIHAVHLATRKPSQETVTRLQTAFETL